MTNTIDRIIEMAIQIQQIPAPTLHEEKRGEFVQKLFMDEGLQDVTIDDAGNVYGLLPKVQGDAPSLSKGQKTKVNPLIISAHLDTVFPLEMDLSVTREDNKIYGIGIGDNSLGVAALFGLIWMLRERQIELGGDIWFVANTCEEGLGDLRGMKAVVERFNQDVHAYLVLEGMALGHVYHKAIGVKRYRVIAKTRGGHSWSDYGQPSAVLELSNLIAELSSLRLPSKPRTTMNVGKIRGGTSINVIPAEACLELDLRSEDTSVLADLVGKVEKLIEGANKPGVSMEANVIGTRPAGEMSLDHRFIELAKSCLYEQGLDATLTSGSTDANIPLSKGYPALVLGVTNGSGAHTKKEYIDVEPLEKGMEQLVNFVSRVWE